MDESFALDPDPRGRGSVTDAAVDPRPDNAVDPRGAPAVLPTVVAVVVTHDPGPWFEEALGSLVGQDYPNLSILVFDTASAVDPTPRIATIAPRAYVRRLEANPGPGAVANTALSMVEGAPFFLICHDDVALSPNAVRLLVEEAYRSNAGIVGPKLVRWEDPQALLAVGMGADRFGAPFPLCERGELDQEQHDAVRDVFFVPGACFLIRTDLLRALGGFDEAMTFHGEDTDLCWRVHLAGARVLVAPNARVRHVEALGERRDDDRRRLQLRHRLRMVLTNYGWFYLIGEVFQQAVLSLVECLAALVVGRFRHAADVAGAWVWNLRRAGSVVAKRRRIKAQRQVTDLELRRLQVRGSARFTGFVRGQLGGADATASLGDSLRQWLSRRGATAQPQNVGAALVVTLILLFGSRHLLTGSVPAVGEFGLFPDRARDLLRLGWSGWRDSGLGAAGRAPTGLGLFGLVGLLCLGATGLARALLTLGTIPLGLAGVWRLGSFAPHSRAKAAMLLAYAVNPLPYNALAAGRWRALVLYAVLPWIVRALARAAGLEPYGPTSRRVFVSSVATAALGAAVAVTLYPAAAVVVALTGLALAVGSLLSGERRGTLALLAATALSAALGLLLHAPWLLSAWSNHDPDVRRFGEVGGAAEWRLRDLLHFHTGRFGGSWLGWGLLVAGLVALTMGRSWRLGWATRGWCLFAVPLALVVAVQADWVGWTLPPPDVLLAPAALGVALAVGAGMAAFDTDLPAYRFGWRQVASIAGAAGLFAALLPLLFASFNGRWQVSRGGYDRVLGFVDGETAANGPFRVLWLGTDNVLPVAGWPLGDGVTSYATSVGYPSVSSVWTGPDTTATRAIPAALETARAGGNNRLGQQLGVMNVRYIVVIDRSAPTPFDGVDRPAPAWIDTMLSSQLDLATVELNAALRVYRNTAWLPATALVAADVDQAARLPLPDAAAPPVPALRADGLHRFRGTLPGGDSLHLAEAFDPNWKLTVDGDTVAAGTGFGYANRFAATGGGEATLRFVDSRAGLVLWLVQVTAWLLLAAVAFRLPNLGRRRRIAAELATPAALPTTPLPSAAAPRPARRADLDPPTAAPASPDPEPTPPAPQLAAEPTDTDTGLGLGLRLGLDPTAADAFADDGDDVLDTDEPDADLVDTERPDGGGERP